MPGTGAAVWARRNATCSAVSAGYSAITRAAAAATSGAANDVPVARVVPSKAVVLPPTRRNPITSVPGAAMSTHDPKFE